MNIRRPAVVQWVIAGLLAVIAIGLWRGQDTGGVAWAQNQPMAGARGLFAFTGQLDRDSYGLFMLDVDQGTVWCYEVENAGGARRLRLVAARTFMYDRYLQDFNCAPPDFRTVQQLVAQQRQQRAADNAGVDEPPETGDNAPPAGAATDR